MKKNESLIRKGHFIGAKIRNLRKTNNLTMEDLSVRCIQLDPESAPSVSYLSMIENGKRVPSKKMLRVIAEIFQKDLDWFLDQQEHQEAVIDKSSRRGGLGGVALEPEFLFSKHYLQSAIPEMLSQTGTSGRKFAQLLIRTHQEYHQNNFPDLERAAEQLGQRRMPLSKEDLLALFDQMGLKLVWFDKSPTAMLDDEGARLNTMVRSFAESDGRVYMNQYLKTDEARFRFELAVHIAHAALYGDGGLKSVNVSGFGILGKSAFRSNAQDVKQSMSIDSADILQAWRDFECSFFAGALLLPKLPFKQFLDRNAYSVLSYQQLGVSPSVLMRRMTAVSSYRHWHYFDAYTPGKLKAVYRGNGIPLPWGNMNLVQDPCQHWAVFRRLQSQSDKPSAQISILDRDDEPRIYCCESVKVKDTGGNSHVLCIGVDLNPAIYDKGVDAGEMAQQIKQACIENNGSAILNSDIQRELISVARVLNIGWIQDGLEKPAVIICPRSSVCPRNPCCKTPKTNQVSSQTLANIRQDILAEFK